jgi:hypothetical protein
MFINDEQVDGNELRSMFDERDELPPQPLELVELVDDLTNVGCLPLRLG